MSVITEFRVRSPKLVLWEAQQTCPDVELEILQEVGTDPQRPYLFLLVTAADPSAFESALADDPTVTDVERYSEFDDEILYRLQITEETEVVMYPLWVEYGGDVLEAGLAEGWWYNRMRFPDRESLASYREALENEGVEFELTQVFTDDARTARGEAPLSDEQREALLAAYEAGYFSVPREASMADVAEELGVSSQAVSERLRRAHLSLVEHHLD